MYSQSRSITMSLENYQVAEKELQNNINVDANDDDFEKCQQQQHLANERVFYCLFFISFKKFKSFDIGFACFFFISLILIFY